MILFVILLTQIVAWDTSPCDHKHSGLLLLLGAVTGNYLSLVDFILQIDSLD